MTSREEALKLKSICYSKPFLRKFGDWLAAGNEFMELKMANQSLAIKEKLMKKHNVSIELDDGFEPILTDEILEFILSEYDRIFNNGGELEI